MQKVIVYVDDASHARRQLAATGAAGTPAPTHWVLVACAPRMAQRVSKWVTHHAREQWQARWAEKLFREITPHLSRADRVTTVVARGPLPELTSQLVAEHATSRVVDARRPKSGGELRRGSLIGLGLALLLAAD